MMERYQSSPSQNSYYVPEGKVRLLSPQHWAKTQQGSKRRNGNKIHGTLCQTMADDVTLMWNNRQSKLTVLLGVDNNVATFHLAYGCSKYHEFFMEAKVADEEVAIGNEMPMSKAEALQGKYQGVWSKDVHAKFLNGPSKS